MTWMEEYKALKLSRLTKKQLDLLENGPKSLTDAWALGAMKYDYNCILGKQMKIPNWQHHSNKEAKRTLKPQAMRSV